MEELPDRRMRVTEACRACRDRRTKCRGGQPCGACRGRQSECVFDRREQEKAKKRAAPAASSWRALREEISTLRRRVSELETIASSRGGGEDAVCGGPFGESGVACDEPMAPLAAMFHMSQVPTSFTIPHLTPREIEYVRLFTQTVVHTSDVVSKGNYSYLMGIVAASEAPAVIATPTPQPSNSTGTSSPGSTQAAKLIRLSPARYMGLYGAMALAAWWDRDFLVARGYVNKGGLAFQHIMRAPCWEGVQSLGMFGALLCSLMHRMSSLAHYTGAETCVQFLRDKRPAEVDESYAAQLKANRQSLELKIFKHAPSDENKAGLASLASLSEPMGVLLPRLAGVLMTFMCVTSWKYPLSDEWKTYGREAAERADALLKSVLERGEEPPPHVHTLIDTFRSLLCWKCMDFSAAVMWGKRALTGFSTLNAEKMTLLDLSMAAQLYECLHRLGETAILGPLKDMLERQAAIWPVSAYTVFKRVHGKGLTPYTTPAAMPMHSPTPVTASGSPPHDLPLLSSALVQPSRSPHSLVYPTASSAGAGGRLTPFTLDGDGEVFSYDSSDEGFAQFMGADSADLDLQALFGASGAADDANLALLSQIIP